MFQALSSVYMTFLCKKSCGMKKINFRKISFYFKAKKVSYRVERGKMGPTSVFPGLFWLNVSFFRPNSYFLSDKIN